MAKETGQKTVTENEEGVTIQRSKEVELSDLEKENDVYGIMRKKWAGGGCVNFIYFFL